MSYVDAIRQQFEPKRDDDLLLEYPQATAGLQGGRCKIGGRCKVSIPARVMPNENFSEPSI